MIVFKDKQLNTPYVSVYKDKTDMYGLIHKKVKGEKTKIKLKACYHDISNFYSGFAITRKWKKYGIISETGEIILKPTYNFISSFKKNKKAVFKKGNKYGLIDSCGDVIIQPIYDDLLSTRVGNLYIYDVNDKKNGLLNIDTNEVIIQEGKYDLIYTTDEFNIVNIGTKNGIIDHSGRVLLDTKYYVIRVHRLSGEIIVRVDDAIYKYIDGDLIDTKIHRRDFNI